MTMSSHKNNNTPIRRHDATRIDLEYLNIGDFNPPELFKQCTVKFKGTKGCPGGEKGNFNMDTMHTIINIKFGAAAVCKSYCPGIAINAASIREANTSEIVNTTIRYAYDQLKPLITARKLSTIRFHCTASIFGFRPTHIVKID